MRPQLLLPLGLLGCAAEPDAASASARKGGDIAAGRLYEEGSPEALGLQDFLNHESTTFELLDDDVRLDRRAAANLIERRDGPDATPGTADDQPYLSIAEIDAVSYVGDSALTKLFDWAIAHGWVAADAVPLRVEGVEFTEEQAAATLELVHTAAQIVLDDDVGLDRRAADNIVAERPFDDLDQLAAVSYVGGSALERLRDFAADPTADLGATEEEACDTALECQAGLVCMGEYAWGGGGWCVSEDLAGTFSAAPAVAIPDAGSRGVSDTLAVTGLASVSIDIVVTLDIDHDRPEDLRVTLTNPSGTVARVARAEADLSEPFVARGIPSDEDANGDWTLTVVDEASGRTGTLHAWSVYIISQWD